MKKLKYFVQAGKSIPIYININDNQTELSIPLCFYCIKSYVSTSVFKLCCPVRLRYGSTLHVAHTPWFSVNICLLKKDIKLGEK